MQLITTAHPERPELDMTFTGALLEAAALAEAGDTVRVFRPGPTVAFGRMDRLRPGFEEACRIAEAHGRTPLVRLGGGHAVAYDSESLVVEIVRRHEHGITDLESRFSDMARWLQRTFAEIGVRLDLGELPGEYCPGRYSLHLPAGPKVAGIAQRVRTRASLTTAVVVVSGGEALRAVIAEVYEALELPLDVATVGAVSDQHPEISCEPVERALVQSVAQPDFGLK